MATIDGISSHADKLKRAVVLYLLAQGHMFSAMISMHFS
jgi:hypothetical protein